MFEARNAARQKRKLLRSPVPVMLVSVLLIICVGLALSLAFSGCSPSCIASVNDPGWFKEGPKMVTRDGRYFFRFRYSEHPDSRFAFFMMAWSTIRNDKLIFYIPVTTSSGNCKGRLQFEEIVSQDKLSLAKKGSVYWMEPDGTLIPLEIKPMEESLNIISSSVREH